MGHRPRVCRKIVVRARHAFVALAFALSGCGSSATPAGPSLPAAIVVRVDRVVVSPTKLNTTAPWDGEAPEPTAAPCAFIGMAVGLMSMPIAGKGADYLCQLGQERGQTERQASDPDLQIRVSASAGKEYVSSVRYDSTAETFKFEVVVPTSAIPADGLRITVVDHDAGAGPQQIGEVRVTRAAVVRTLAQPTQLLVVADQGVKQLELALSKYEPVSIAPTEMPASDGLRTASTRALYAGEVVQLRAAGRYRVGSWYDDPVDPAGYPGHQARSYNFEQEPFHSAPHACGIATVGTREHLDPELVLRSTTFVARVPGPLRFGLNDNDPENNKGIVTFQGLTRAPTAEEWLGQRVPAG
jgi:hypothetical protein